MTFVQPLGLLGLIGIPIVILIYILRSKYTEQTVTSTYIWNLSERFLKRRNPLSGLTGIISLILQILMIIAISLTIAHPKIVLRGTASDYYFMLDGSGSMNMYNGEKTRYELGQEKIAQMIAEADSGSTFSLVSVSDETYVVYSGVSDKDFATEMLYKTEAADGAVEHTDAVGAAQKYFTDNPSALVYLVTDKDFSEKNNVEIIDVSGSDEKNFSLSDVKHEHSGGSLTVYGSVLSHTTDETLTVSLFVDDKAAPLSTAEVSASVGVAAEFSLSGICSGFESFTVRVENSDVYSADNEITVYNTKSEKTYSTLIVSETPFFMQAALDAILDSTVDTVSPEDYEKDAYVGYGLYIFHSYTPKSLPDGAVWLMNCDESIEDSGFGIRGRVTLDASEEIEISKNTNTNIRRLLDGVEGKGIHIASYLKYSGMYLNFSELFSYNGDPLIFAGANGLGNRQVVFGFDIHQSDIALSADFVLLLSNLLEYSFPDILEDRSYYVCGEEITVNKTANMESVKATSPSGKEIFLDTVGDTAVFTADEVGTYTVIMNVAGGENIFKIYSSAHPDESVPDALGETFSLSGDRQNERGNGEYDPINVLFICLAVIFVADWMVYCYEKYQLR